MVGLLLVGFAERVFVGVEVQVIEPGGLRAVDVVPVVAFEVSLRAIGRSKVILSDGLQIGILQNAL
jgi:hypothetical protein